MMTKEQFKRNRDKFEQAEALEQVRLSYDQYHGYYHIVANKEVLERLEIIAKETANAIYKNLDIEHKAGEKENNN